MINYKLYLQT